MLFLLLNTRASASAEDATVNDNGTQNDIVIKTPFNPADYKGSYVIAAFISSYCRECINTLTALNKLNDKHTGSGVKVAGIYLDETVNEDEIRKFAEKQKIHFPLYINNRKMLKKYNITFIPTILFLDKAGNVLERHIGHKHEKTLEKKFFSSHADR